MKTLFFYEDTKLNNNLLKITIIFIQLKLKLVLTYALWAETKINGRNEGISIFRAKEEKNVHVCKLEGSS